jgi:CRP-like cAMP-binding protein
MSITDIRNNLLSALAPEELHRLQPLFERVELQAEQSVAEPSAPVSHVYFPEGGFLSVVASRHGREQAEIAMIGREGVSAPCLALGCSEMPFRVVVKQAGPAVRMTSENFLKACEQSSRLTRTILLYSHVLATQMAETSRANARFTVETRLARWLLMAHDRALGNDLSLTHESLSLMLGVRRPGITVSLHILEGEHMIRARRGRISILDRAKLEEASRGSYGLPEEEYRRLLGQGAKSIAALADISRPERSVRAATPVGAGMA